jgi:uncharacterized protein (DUF488 family)
MGNIYTIGYGNIAVDHLVNLLKKYRIAVLVDIRSRPYSKHSPEYRKQNLESIIISAGIRYLYLGDKLGGMPEGRQFYDNQGNVKYYVLSKDPAYLDGINRIIELSREKNICLVCAEADPGHCHRGTLVSETLWRYEMESMHILHNGNILRHWDLRGKLRQSQGDLFEGKM